MVTAPVTPERIAIAKAFGLQNVEFAAAACREVGVPFWAACALLEKESHGANVWGGADASPFSALNKMRVLINHHSFPVFYLGVKAGLVPTGVGPCQITYAGKLQKRSDGTVFRDGGYFRIMEERGLKAWRPYDNMLFGFETLWGHYNNPRSARSWVVAGRLYNGAESYGFDLQKKCEEWRKRLGVPGTINV